MQTIEWFIEKICFMSNGTHKKLKLAKPKTEVENGKAEPPWHVRKHQNMNSADIWRFKKSGPQRLLMHVKVVLGGS